MEDPVLSREVELLAQEIAGDGANHHVLKQARAVAEAQIDLVRIRRARQDLLVGKMMGVDLQGGAGTVTGERGEGTLPPAPELPLLSDQNSLNAVLVLSEVVDQLIKIDRYERRTLSRRKFAVRRFDAACKELARASAPISSRKSQEY